MSEAKKGRRTCLPVLTEDGPVFVSLDPPVSFAGRTPVFEGDPPATLVYLPQHASPLRVAGHVHEVMVAFGFEP